MNAFADGSAAPPPAWLKDTISSSVWVANADGRLNVCMSKWAWFGELSPNTASVVDGSVVAKTKL